MSGSPRKRPRPERALAPAQLAGPCALLALLLAAGAASAATPAKPETEPDMELLEFLGGGNDARNRRQSDPLGLLEEMEDTPATPAPARRPNDTETKP